MHLNVANVTFFGEKYEKRTRAYSLHTLCLYYIILKQWVAMIHIIFITLKQKETCYLYMATIRHIISEKSLHKPGYRYCLILNCWINIIIIKSCIYYQMCQHNSFRCLCKSFHLFNLAQGLNICNQHTFITVARTLWTHFILSFVPSQFSIQWTYIHKSFVSKLSISK